MADNAGTNNAASYAQAWANLTGTLPAGFSGKDVNGVTIPTESDLQKYEAAIKQVQGSWANYQSEYSQICNSNESPEQMLQSLVFLLENQGSDVEAGQQNILATGLDAQSDLNTCFNSLLGMTNSTKTTNTQLLHVANGAENIIELCKGTTSLPSDAATLSQALGSDATKTFAGDMDQIRNLIYTGGSVNGDPPLPTSSSDQSASTCWFDASSTPSPFCMTSFGEAHTNAGLQGDPFNASQVFTVTSSNFGAAQTFSSGLQAQVNTNLTQQMNILSGEQSFGSDILHSENSIISHANQVAIQG